MKAIKGLFNVSMVSCLFVLNILQAQETPNSTLDMPILIVENYNPYLNTLILYNYEIINKEDFRFRKEINKARTDTLRLKYKSTMNSLEISKIDYLRLVRKLVNQNDTEQDFINKIMYYFPEDENAIILKLDFKSIYRVTRIYTFFGNFDALPRI